MWLMDGLVHDPVGHPAASVFREPCKELGVCFVSLSRKGLVIFILVTPVLRA